MAAGPAGGRHRNSDTCVNVMILLDSMTRSLTAEIHTGDAAAHWQRVH